LIIEANLKPRIMKIFRLLSASIYFLILSVNIQAQKPDLTDVKIITHQITESIYMLEATGDVAGNIGVSVGNDGILIIDDQWAELSEQIETALNEISKGELKYIINTHHHDDHMDGNANLSKNSGATIIAQSRTRERLLELEKDYWPNLTFDQNLSLFFNDDEINAISFPGGHTDNDIIIFFKKANVVHLGDLLNSGSTSFPTADYSAGGNAFNLVNILEEVIPLIPDDAIIIAGHGPLSNKSELIETYEMVKETTAIIKSKIEKGMSLDKIQKEGLPKKFDEWNHGYTKDKDWIEMIYRSYSK
jgi:cyclase